MTHQILPPAIPEVPTSTAAFLVECERLSLQIALVQAELTALRARVQAVVDQFHDGEPVWNTVEQLEEALQ